MKLILLFCLSLVLAGMCPAAIFYPKAPDAGWQIASNNLNTTFFGVSSKEDLTITVPCREYFAGASNLASGHLLSTARIGGWRYPVIFETNVVGAVELIPDGKNGNIHGFNSL